MKEHSAYFPLLPDPFPRFADYLPPAPTVEPSQRVEAIAPVVAPTGERPEAAAEAQEAVRVQLIGRAGRNPTLTERQDPRKTKATFPLAVRESSDKPTWYTVVAFGDRSRHVMEIVKQGNSYEVVGYKHESLSQARDGTERVKTEIYAARVIPR